MRLLDRYLLREFLIPLGYCLGGFLLFWVSFDLLSQLDDFQHHHLLVKDLVAYYLVKTPELLVTVMPVALLLALLYALTNHARHQELTAMRAAGISLWRLCVPYLAAGSLLSLVLFALNEILVPDGNQAANEIMDRRLPERTSAAERLWHRNLTFHNERDQRIWNIGAYNQQTSEMLAVHIDWRSADGSLRRLFAQRALYTNHVWRLFQVKEMDYLPPPNTVAPPPTETNELALAELTETPERIRSEIKFGELSNFRAAKRPRLSLREILDYERLHPQLNARDYSKLATQFHGRCAEPWTCLVVVLIAIPFGAPGGRRNVFVGVAGSIFIGFTYFILLRLGLALGTGGYLPPWLAAWLPNLVFGLGGILLTQRVR